MARSKTVQQVLEETRTKRGLRIGSLSEAIESVEALSTGNIALDYLTGVGGLPKSRVTEFFGPPSSGKTTCAISLAAQAQKLGEYVVYLDYENSFDPDYAMALGLDAEDEKFIITQPDTMEEGINAMRDLIRTGEIGVSIVDSVAAMTLERELKAETGDMSVSARDKARFMAQAMRQLNPECRTHGTMLILLNHIQDVMPSALEAKRGIKKTTTTGGSAPKFYASVRMEFRQLGNQREKIYNPLTNTTEDVITQTDVLATCIKNKVGPPFRNVVVRTIFGRGFSQGFTVSQLLAAHGVIEVQEKTGIYRFPNEDTRPKGMDPKKAWVKGERELAARIDDDPEWLARLLPMAEAILEEHGLPTPTPRKLEESPALEEALTSES